MVIQGPLNNQHKANTKHVVHSAPAGALLLCVSTLFSPYCFDQACHIDDSLFSWFWLAWVFGVLPGDIQAQLQTSAVQKQSLMAMPDCSGLPCCSDAPVTQHRKLGVPFGPARTPRAAFARGWILRAPAESAWNVPVTGARS